MKKTLLFMTLTVWTLAANAQTFRGDWLIDCCFGGLKYSSTNKETSFSNNTIMENNDRTAFGIRIHPGAAWFVRDNLAVGGRLSFEYSSNKNETSNTGSTFTSTSNSTMPSFYIGPMARYYFGGNDKCKPFGQLDFQYGISSEKDKDANSFGTSETTTESKNSWKTGISLGYEYIFTPNVGVYGSLGFNYEQGKTVSEFRPSSNPGYDETTEYRRFYIPFNVGLQVHILGKERSRL